MPSSSVMLYNAERLATDLSRRLKRKIELAKLNPPATDTKWNRHRYVKLDDKAVSSLLPQEGLRRVRWVRLDGR